jgi:hypothetical protein
MLLLLAGLLPGYQQQSPLLVLVVLKWLAHYWIPPSMRNWRHPHNPTAASSRHTLLLAPLASLRMMGLRPTLRPPPPHLLLLLLPQHLPG